MEILLDIVSAAVAAAIVVWIVWAVRRYRRRRAVERRHPGAFLAREARVLRKYREQQKTRVRCMVEFCYATGETLTLEVPAPLYDAFEVGAQDDLVTKRGAFWGFGGLLVPGARQPRKTEK